MRTGAWYLCFRGQSPFGDGVFVARCLLPRIFISYRHIDNEALVDNQKGWVDQFRDALRITVAQYYGINPDVWQDPNLPGNAPLTQELQAALVESDVLLTMLSPAYANSEWCKRELRMFCEAAKTKHRALRVGNGNRWRILKVVVLPKLDGGPLDPPEVPELAECLGYEFFRKDNGGVTHRFDIGTPAFFDVLTKLATDLGTTLQELNGAPAATTGGTVVYLAETSDDLADAATSLRRELEQYGHTVLPRAAYPSSMPQYRDAVRADLREAVLSIHPVGKAYRVLPEYREQSVAELQYAAAGDEAKSRPDFTRLPWIPPELTVAGAVTDAAQVAFLAQLNADPKLRITLLETLKTEVRQLLAPPASNGTTPTSGKIVYLAETSRDLTTAAAGLRESLEREGHTVLPETPYEPYLPEYANAVRSDLARSSLSIHLVGNVYRVLPEERDRSVIELQYELAGDAAHSRSEFARLAWIAPGLATTDTAQLDFVQRLRAADPTLPATLEELDAQVRQRLAPPPADAPASANGAQPPGSGATPPLVYLLYDACDVAAVRPLRRALVDAAKCNILNSPSGTDETALRENHVKALTDCDAVLIYQGTSDANWLTTMTTDVYKSKGYGRSGPFRAAAVFFGDPERPDKEDFASADILTLNGYSEFRAATLDEFVRRLAKPAAGISS